MSRRLGKPSNRTFDQAFKSTVKAIVEQQTYFDYGPTLMAESLEQDHKITLSKETLRHWMTDWGVWKVKHKRPKRTHPRRPRREKAGELVQIDGSPHHWFEDRGPTCCLIVFIDDASGRITARFSPTETAFAYMAALRQYIKRYGLPRALYHDRNSVFTINTSDKLNQREQHTQFGRILNDLGIESINAYSPQAKGRVERANQTLQDRLVKFLRKKGIASINEANACLPELIDSYNRRFSLSV